MEGSAIASKALESPSNTKVEAINRISSRQLQRDAIQRPKHELIASAKARRIVVSGATDHITDMAIRPISRISRTMGTMGKALRLRGRLSKLLVWRLIFMALS